jgi:hypothetical protein
VIQLFVFAPCFNDSAVGAARMRGPRVGATKSCDRDFPQEGIQSIPRITNATQLEEDGRPERYTAISELDRKNSIPGGVLPPCFRDDSILDRVSSAEANGYSFARAVMFQVLRTKWRVWVANPFLSLLRTLGRCGRPQVCLIAEIVKAPLFY